MCVAEGAGGREGWLTCSVDGAGHAVDVQADLACAVLVGTGTVADGILTPAIADLQTQAVGARFGCDGCQAEAGWEVGGDFGGGRRGGDEHEGSGGDGGECESHDGCMDAG